MYSVLGTGKCQEICDRTTLSLCLVSRAGQNLTVCTSTKLKCSECIKSEVWTNFTDD